MQHRTKDYTLSLASNVTITNIKFTFNISSIGRTNKNTELNVNVLELPMFRFSSKRV